MSDVDDADRRWEHWLVHLLWSVSVRTSTLGEAALAGSPVTLAGLGVLENIHAEAGITIAEIARRAPQTQQALSQVAARLEKLGLVERRLAARGRGVALHLTPAGAAAHRDAHAMTEAFESELATALGSARHQRLLTLLEEMRTIVADLQPDGRPAPPVATRPRTRPAGR